MMGIFVCEIINLEYLLNILLFSVWFKTSELHFVALVT